MKKVVLLAFVSFSLCVVGLLRLQIAYASPYTNINVDTAYNMITNGSYPDLVVLDVRTQSEYDGGHIYGAVWIPHTELETRIDELAGHKNHEIIVYCASGGRSVTASEILDSHGFTKVYNMLGGFNNWDDYYPVWIATVHNVNTTFNYDTIQAAIDATQTLNGHTILVHNGTYYEHVIVNKSISLIGENVGGVIIDGGGIGTVVTVQTNNVSINRFTIRNSGAEWQGSWWDSAILLNNSNNNDLVQNKIINNHCGIWLEGSTSNTITRNYISENSMRGIILVNSANNTLVENNVTDNGEGISLLWSFNNNLTNNVMSENRYNFGIFGENLDHFIQDIGVSNTVNGKPIHYLINQNNLVIDPSTFPDIGYLGLVNSTNITVNELDLTHNLQGTLIAYSTNSRIKNNKLTNTVYGISLVDSVNNTIAENNITDNVYGVGLRYSLNNTLSGNHITNNVRGVLLIYSANNNTITRNNIVANEFTGIDLTASTYNVIYGNNITDNKYGMWVDSSSNNSIYHNNFVDNTIQVNTSNSMNVWDDDYPSGGNYWSDYTGVDVKSGPNQDQPSSDGIGDTAYVIDDDNRDNYPLMYPWGTPPPPSYTLTIYSSPSGVTFTIDDVSRTTLWLGTYGEGASISLEMPEIHTAGDTKYYWNQWSDGNTSRSRTVTMNTNITLTAQYIIEPYYQLNVTSSPITGVTFTINGASQTTPYAEWLLEGSYTLVMPEIHDGHIWSHWLEDGDTNRIKTIILNTTTTLTAVFTPDATPPTISIVSPENKTYPVKDVPLTFTVSESTSWIGYSLDGQMNVTISGNTTIVGLPDGTHTITVYANDTTGNMGHSDTVYFTVDTVSPNIEILSPENKTYTTSSVSLSLTVDEATSWIGYSLDGHANVTITGNTTLSGLSDGAHTITLYAKDTTGNMGASDMVYFTIQTSPIDTAPPSISIGSPENKTYDTTDIPLTFTVDESVLWIGYSLDNKANVTITGNTTLSGLSDGSHSLIVYAKDAAGNTGASEIVYFSIKTKKPEPFQTWIIAAMVIIAAVGTTLLIYFAKIKKTTKKVGK